MPRKANAAAKSFLNLSELVSWGITAPKFLSAPRAQRSLKAWGSAPGLWECENDQR